MSNIKTKFIEDVSALRSKAQKLPLPVRIMAKANGILYFILAVPLGKLSRRAWGRRLLKPLFSTAAKIIVRTYRSQPATSAYLVLLGWARLGIISQTPIGRIIEADSNYVIYEVAGSCPGRLTHNDKIESCESLMTLDHELIALLGGKLEVVKNLTMPGVKHCLLKVIWNEQS